ncbi:hypothetical protein GP486_000504 [Trichoglossum hirsutum]|uniref:Uncharacterized protein n=1 Tax=Trichoglossum hirsutum TaxID=265104 RepID=A0A9P8LIV4_9PEZI|nr:hypothetical protein GP486_000504 [Trichoglossum hirsutum]
MPIDLGVSPSGRKGRVWVLNDNVDGYRPVQLSNAMWSQLRAVIPGTRTHIFLMVETRKTDGRETQDEPEDSLFDFPDTDEVLDSEPLVVDQYIMGTLDFVEQRDQKAQIGEAQELWPLFGSSREQRKSYI